MVRMAESPEPTASIETSETSEATASRASHEPSDPGADAAATAGPRRRAFALSPSRAKDFRQCPLMFRLRVVDHVPEPPSPAALRGTLVHAVLERLFDLEPQRRTPAEALRLLEEEWPALRGKRPEAAEMFADEAELEAWLGAARELVERYFSMENPQRLDPAGREQFVETRLGSGLLVRGVVDRIDVAPGGAVRVVDYKTGRSPRPRYTEEALFQLRFYALVLQRLRGTLPTRLQILYLRDGRTLTHDPVQEEIDAVELEIDELWQQILAAARDVDFPPRTGPLCPWCNFHALCPAQGGVAPLPPEEGLAALTDAGR